MFTVHCFIRKNTPELQEKLKRLGYIRNYLDDNNRPWLAVNYNMFISVDEGFQNLPTDDIDCGENEDLFLALAAIREDKPDYQWFVWDDKEDDGDPWKQYIPGENWEDWWWFEVHKASVEELIEHFRDEKGHV